MSKYIGETEKNLAGVLDTARDQRWILFFDEADALFGKRSEVKDARDRFANQEVSYLLQRIEEFDGVVILTTNFRKNVDGAFLRRVDAVIEFPLPEQPEREASWRGSLPNSADFAPKLARFELSGAKIVNAVRYACLQAVRREFAKDGKDFEIVLDSSG